MIDSLMRLEFAGDAPVMAQAGRIGRYRGRRFFRLPLRHPLRHPLRM
jgi:hypothetical protein